MDNINIFKLYLSSYNNKPHIKSSHNHNANIKINDNTHFESSSLSVIDIGYMNKSFYLTKRILNS